MDEAVSDPDPLPPYTSLSGGSKLTVLLSGSGTRTRNVKALALSLLLLLPGLLILIPNRLRDPIPLRQLPRLENVSVPCVAMSRGVSEKVERCGGGGVAYDWTNEMLAWQRTAFHFQPQKNWMNDPDGPLYHMGWYHLFYQYNPDSATWGNITWGHAVSSDLIHWLYLPIAMIPDRWYDFNGVWTGSATTLPDGSIVMLYTGDTVDSVQVQNLAYPANLSDPLLLNWVKYPNNPVITPPPGIGIQNFRDPTTAWSGPNETWRIAIGSKINETGISLVYSTTNFTSFELLDGPLHGVTGTGMWECVDFYPVGPKGLDSSTNGPVKYVLKASLDHDKHDYYAIGSYDPEKAKWSPDNQEDDVGIGRRVDYGKYYASKSFYDQRMGDRILWGWSGETDSSADDIAKGWASVQTIPRVAVLDKKTGSNLLQWPVEEVNNLRLQAFEFNGVALAPGAVIPLQVGEASQLDIIADFELNEETLRVAGGVEDAVVGHNCSGGAAQRGPVGPFGLIVIADDVLSEQTPVYFYVSRSKNGNLKTLFCVDETRSSKASSVGKRVYGSTVPVLEGEKFSLRTLVDHSIVESFAQGGRVCITSRVYPTEAILGATRLFLFNNATKAVASASIKVWHVDSALIHPYPFD